MKFLRFLKCESPYILLYGVVFFATLLILFTDPDVNWHTDTLLYTVFIVLIVLACFLVIRYRIEKRNMRLFTIGDSNGLSMEAAHYQTMLQQMEKKYLRQLNEVRQNQQNYYDFIMSWFHEIKTPISVLRLMQQTRIDQSSLADEVEKIEHYVDLALYYAKSDSFNQDYDIRSYLLAPIIKEQIKAHSKTFISKKIKVKFDDCAFAVQTDKKWLSFILSQLLSNALKYTPENGTISIHCTEEKSELWLFVKDNGIGIPAEDIPRVFNRGFTGENGRQYARSTGMGLYLAQELAKKLGHTISCSAKKGHYTEMTIHFPHHNDPYRELLKSEH